MADATAAVAVLLLLLLGLTRPVERCSCCCCCCGNASASTPNVGPMMLLLMLAVTGASLALLLPDVLCLMKPKTSISCCCCCCRGLVALGRLSLLLLWRPGLAALTADEQIERGRQLIESGKEIVTNIYMQDARRYLRWERPWQEFERRFIEWVNEGCPLSGG